MYINTKIIWAVLGGVFFAKATVEHENEIRRRAHNNGYMNGFNDGLDAKPVSFDNPNEAETGSEDDRN